MNFNCENDFEYIQLPRQSQDTGYVFVSQARLLPVYMFSLCPVL